jgi:5,5'-dehydrodivanillate O-demethylase
VPDWELFHQRGYKQIVFSEIPCNWFQGQENSIDPIHFEWLHSNWSLALKGESGSRAPTHAKIGFSEFEWGFVYRRVRADTDEQDELWTVGRVCLWPNGLYTGKFEWRVPIDDETTLHVAWFNDPLPGPEPFEQPRIPCWHAPVKDPVTGRWITSHVMNQDFVAWVGQGAIADRTKEHLGESDRGVIMMRRRLLEDAERVAAGGEPKAVIRDPEKNVCVELPIIGRRFFVDGYSAEDSDRRRERTPGLTLPRDFPFLTGQPEEIRHAFWRAMGFEAPPAR